MDKTKDSNWWFSSLQIINNHPQDARRGKQADVTTKTFFSTRDSSLKKQITVDLHKGILLKRYKKAARLNRYKPAISGTNTWMNNLVKKDFPEWGKILASKIDTNHKVNYDAMHKPKSRYHTAVVMCEDQGYKVLPISSCRSLTKIMVSTATLRCAMVTWSGVKP